MPRELVLIAEGVCDDLHDPGFGYGTTSATPQIIWFTNIYQFMIPGTPSCQGELQTSSTVPE
jgi:hypothetical protein